MQSLKRGKSSLMEKSITNLFRGLSIVIVPVAASVPSVSILQPTTLTNTHFSLITVRLCSNVSVCKAHAEHSVSVSLPYRVSTGPYRISTVSRRTLCFSVSVSNGPYRVSTVSHRTFCFSVSVSNGPYRVSTVSHRTFCFSVSVSTGPYRVSMVSHRTFCFSVSVSTGPYRVSTVSHRTFCSKSLRCAAVWRFPTRTRKASPLSGRCGKWLKWDTCADDFRRRNQTTRRSCDAPHDRTVSLTGFCTEF